MDNRQAHANYLTNEEKAIKDELQESYRQQRRHGNNEEQETSRIVCVLNLVPFTPPRLLVMRRIILFVTMDVLSIL